MRTLTSKGESIETALTDEEAVQALRQVQGNALAGKLAAQWDRTHSLSPAQLFWAHKIALTSQGAATGGPDLLPIVLLLRKGARHVRLPKMRLWVPTPITLGFSSQAAAQFGAVKSPRHPGSVNVTDGAPFGHNAWYGRIMPGGEFVKSRACTGVVLDTLTEMAADPLGVVAAAGRAAGKCPFCGDDLTGEAVAAGYGQTCALNWGNLPWGISLSQSAGPAFDEERAFDHLIAEADRLDQERADAAN